MIDDRDFFKSYNCLLEEFTVGNKGDLDKSPHFWFTKLPIFMSDFFM